MAADHARKGPEHDDGGYNLLRGYDVKSARDGNTMLYSVIPSAPAGS
jgi:hypothetical protein